MPLPAAEFNRRLFEDTAARLRAYAATGIGQAEALKAAPVEPVDELAAQLAIAAPFHPSADQRQIPDLQPDKRAGGGRLVAAKQETFGGNINQIDFKVGGAVAKHADLLARTDPFRAAEHAGAVGRVEPESGRRDAQCGFSGGRCRRAWF